jgi:hypothetical protein
MRLEGCCRLFVRSPPLSTFKLEALLIEVFIKHIYDVSNNIKVSELINLPASAPSIVCLLRLWLRFGYTYETYFHPPTFVLCHDGPYCSKINAANHIKKYCHVFMAPWLKITGSGWDDWIYWRIILQSLVIIINYIAIANLPTSQITRTR